YRKPGPSGPTTATASIRRESTRPGRDDRGTQPPPRIAQSMQEGFIMKAQIIKFLKEEDGITALEYGILAAIVAGVIATVFGSDLKTKVFDPIMQALADAAGYVPPTN